MTEDEIEAVAEELAKAGGVSWYPGRVRGPLLKVVSDRYRELARLAIATLDRAQKASDASEDIVQVKVLSAHTEPDAPVSSTIQPGATVVYRAPGEQRAYPCRVETVEGHRAYLVPHLRAWAGWVPITNLSLAPLEEESLNNPSIKTGPAFHCTDSSAGKVESPGASIVSQENGPIPLQGGLSLTEEEVEAVAVELAKAGGVSRHRGAERGPLKLVMDRYRDRARLAIATLERVRAARQGTASAEIKLVQRVADTKANQEPAMDGVVSTRSLMLYRPPGDQRTYPCRVEKIEGNRAYLVPELPACTGWVDLNSLPFPAVQ